MIESRSPNSFVINFDSSPTTALGQSLGLALLGVSQRLPCTSQLQYYVVSFDSNKKASFKKELLSHSNRIEANHSDLNLKFSANPVLLARAGASSNAHGCLPNRSWRLASLQMDSGCYRKRTDTSSFVARKASVPRQSTGDILSPKIHFPIAPLIAAAPSSYPAKHLQTYRSELFGAQERIFSCDWSSVTVAEFKLLATSDRRIAQQIQLVLQSPASSISALLLLIGLTKQDLICDKFGCYVLRDALARSEALSREVIDMVIKNLHYFSCFESSSRVLQALAKKHLDVAEQYLCAFERDWSTLSKKISAIFLFAVCLKSVGQSSHIAIRISQLLAGIFSRTKEKTSKQMKRVMVSFLDSCRDRDLEKFYPIVGFRDNFADMLGDKYMVYIFLKFLSRGFRPAERDLVVALKTRLAALVLAKNFRFMLEKLFQADRSPIKTTIHNIIVGQLRIPPFDRTSDVSQADQNYLYELVTSTTESDPGSTTLHIECPDLHPLLNHSAANNSHSTVQRGLSPGHLLKRV